MRARAARSSAAPVPAASVTEARAASGSRTRSVVPAIFRGEGWEGLAMPPGSLSPAMWALLGSAAERAIRNWPPELHGYAEPHEVEPSMRRICLTVRDALEGRRAELTDAESLRPLRPVLDALRSEFIAASREAPSRPDTAELLQLLAAMEGAQRLLDDTASERFAERLSGMDALNLVVEVAHDMRSPLGSILFLAERLRTGQSGPVDLVQERQLGLIYSAAFGLSSLASDVMELARGGARLIGPHPIAFSLGEIYSNVKSILLPMAEEKRLQLEFVGLEVDWRVGHPAALNRVILNLATNALKFTNEGKVVVAATPTSRTSVEFSVTDTGRGIPDSVLATLFDSFRRRVTDQSYAFSSAGLGLAICQKLIRAMGSELVVDTELEQGTRFSFVVDVPAAARM